MLFPGDLAYLLPMHPPNLHHVLRGLLPIFLYLLNWEVFSFLQANRGRLDTVELLFVALGANWSLFFCLFASRLVNGLVNLYIWLFISLQSALRILNILFWLIINGLVDLLCQLFGNLLAVLLLVNFAHSPFLSLP